MATKLDPLETWTAISIKLIGEEGGIMTVQTQHGGSSALARGALIVPRSSLHLSYRLSNDVGSWNAWRDHSKWGVMGKYACFGDKNREYIAAVVLFALKMKHSPKNY